MSEASYDRQHLAIHAAGFISGDGTTAVTFGCTMTRIGTGQYGMVLDGDAGLVADESFIEVTVKGTTAAMAVASDTSNTVKTVDVLNDGASSEDRDIEVILFKSVTR